MVNAFVGFFIHHEMRSLESAGSNSNLDTPRRSFSSSVYVLPERKHDDVTCQELGRLQGNRKKT